MTALLDLAFCITFWSFGARAQDAQLFAALLTGVLQALLCRDWPACSYPSGRKLVGFLLGTVLRGVVFALITKIGFASPHLAFLAAVACSATWRPIWRNCASSVVVPPLAMCIVGYSFVVRFFALDLPELIPQEAYYWSYAQHLALGYLDHPPLSAWMIAFWTSLVGNNEFAVRFSSLICSIITIGFVHRLTCQAFGRDAAWTAAALGASLPYLFGSGFLMSPDAPLVAAWAAALYYIFKIAHSTPDDRAWSSWLALGLAMGLGMISKYTIVLVAAAAFLLFVWRSSLRRWFLKPQPYVALLLALLCCTPVLYWNATHGWASFVFQGSRRFSGSSEFALPLYLMQLLFLGTPTAIIVAIWSMRRYRIELLDRQPAIQFCLLFFLFPTLIFMVYSLRHETKIIWAGPAFLALLPLLGFYLSRLSQLHGHARSIQMSWFVMAPLSLVGFGMVIYYSALGFPKREYSPKSARLIGWETLARKVVSNGQQLASSTGAAPLVVGMDKHYTAAELAFYTRALADEAGASPLQVAGRNLVGRDSLMFHYWQPSGDLRGKDAILVSRTRSDLEFPELENFFTRTGPIEEFRATRNGLRAGRYFIRQAFGYRHSHPPTDEVFFLPE